MIELTNSSPSGPVSSGYSTAARDSGGGDVGELSSSSFRFGFDFVLSFSFFDVSFLSLLFASGFFTSFDALLACLVDGGGCFGLTVGVLCGRPSSFFSGLFFGILNNTTLHLLSGFHKCNFLKANISYRNCNINRYQRYPTVNEKYNHWNSRQSLQITRLGKKV